MGRANAPAPSAFSVSDARTFEVADRFDLVVIGGGPGGYVAAIRAAQLGKTVAVVEKRAALGGTCLNIGCIPSKALLDSSEHYHYAKEKLGIHGVQVGKVTLDLKAMMTRKDSVVTSLTTGIAGLMKKNKVAVLTGTGRVASPTSVEVTDAKGAKTTFETGHILIATGSVPTELPVLPFDHKNIVDSTGALAFDKVPNHLIVVGGGYIGLELGSVWKRLGAKVTVVEFLDRLVPFADHEVGDFLKRSLQQQGLEFHFETKVTGGKVVKDKVTVTADSKSGPVSFEGDKVLVSVGRRAYTDGLGLEAVGITLAERTGKVPVDKQFRTAVPTISALGDVIDGPMLAHKAEDEGMAFAEILAGKPGHVNYETIPSVIYTWPEMASVGLTEQQAQGRGIDYRVGKFLFKANGRARAMEETEGYVKVLADAKTDRVIGVHIIGPRASDMIAEAVAVMEFGGSAEDIARTCHSHPTLSEALKEAALAVDKRAIHS
jgi:dihydrolipoamide dehydrogenase